MSIRIRMGRRVGYTTRREMARRGMREITHAQLATSVGPIEVADERHLDGSDEAEAWLASQAERRQAQSA